MLYNECEIGKINWVSKIRDMLNVTGFNCVWLYPQSVVTNVFVPFLKQRLSGDEVLRPIQPCLCLKILNPLSKFHSTFLQFQMLNSDNILQQ